MQRCLICSDDVRLAEIIGLRCIEQVVRILSGLSLASTASTTFAVECLVDACCSRYVSLGDVVLRILTRNSHFPDIYGSPTPRQPMVTVARLLLIMPEISASDS
jgi:hypothetical protein